MLFRIKLVTISFILSIIIFSSCTVEKRTYRKGYYVNWHHRNDGKKEKALAHNTENAIQEPSKKETVIVSHNASENALALANADEEVIKKAAPRKTIFSKDDCGDMITMKNGDELKVKVIEINDKEIKYKRCDNLDGPLITVNKSDVFMIKYANGTKEVFKDTPSTKPNQQQQPQNNGNKNVNKQPEVLPLAIASLVAGLLWVYFLGSIAAIIMGAIAIRKINEEPGKYQGKGLAIAGIVLGALAMFILILAILLVLSGF